MVDTQTGEMIERRLEHESGEARAFYAALPTPARVGIEATGPIQWLEGMLTELGHELWVGGCGPDPRPGGSETQKTDSRDAAHITGFVAHEPLPAHLGSLAERARRFKLVCFRTSVKNQLHALAMGQGMCRKRKLWSSPGRQELERLPLAPWASRRRKEFHPPESVWKFHTW